MGPNLDVFSIKGNIGKKQVIVITPTEEQMGYNENGSIWLCDEVTNKLLI